MIFIENSVLIVNVLRVKVYNNFHFILVKYALFISYFVNFCICLSDCLVSVCPQADHPKSVLSTWPPHRFIFLYFSWHLTRRSILFFIFLYIVSLCMDIKFILVLPLHGCVYTQYFPECCEKISHAYMY